MNLPELLSPSLLLLLIMKVVTLAETRSFMTDVTDKVVSRDQHVSKSDLSSDEQQLENNRYTGDIISSNLQEVEDQNIITLTSEDDDMVPETVPKVWDTLPLQRANRPSKSTLLAALLMTSYAEELLLQIKEQEELLYMREQYETYSSGEAIDMDKRGDRVSMRSMPPQERCHRMCGHCQGHVGLRWGVLCKVQCEQGGDALQACLAIYTLRSTGELGAL